MSDEQTPLTNEPRPRSLKRVVAASVAVALALGVCAVKAADHGPLALIEIPPTLMLIFFLQLHFSSTSTI